MPRHVVLRRRRTSLRRGVRRIRVQVLGRHMCLGCSEVPMPPLDPCTLRQRILRHIAGGVQIRVPPHGAHHVPGQQLCHKGWYVSMPAESPYSLPSHERMRTAHVTLCLDVRGCSRDVLGRVVRGQHAAMPLPVAHPIQVF